MNLKQNSFIIENYISEKHRFATKLDTPT